MVRGNLAGRNVDILPGNHGAEVDGQPCPHSDESAVTLAHYTGRSPFQTILKFIRGWSKVLAAGEVGGQDWNVPPLPRISRSFATDSRTYCDRPGCIGSTGRRTD